MKRPIVKPYTVTGVTVGAVHRAIVDYYATEEEAKSHADYLHNHPGSMNVEISGPAYSGKRTSVTPEDSRVGAWMAAALEDRKVCPSMKYDLNAWLDSKDWT